MVDKQVAANINAEKAALRRAVLARRDALDARVRARKSAAICDALARELLGGAPDAAGEMNGATTRVVSARPAAVANGYTAQIVPARSEADKAGLGPLDRADRSAISGPAATDAAISTPRTTPTRTGGRFARHRPTVAVYAAFGSEADPSAFAQAAEHAGWRVAYPCMLPHESTATTGQRMCMWAVTWDDRDTAPFLAHPTRAFAERDIDTARYPLVPARELDAIVVPLVAFDAQRMRLGYSGGCYDRYLPTLSPTCKILGIAFAEQQVEVVPADEHDLPLPRIITA